MIGEKRWCWLYLLQPEDELTPRPCRWVRALKGALWVGLSLLAGLGVGQLS